MQRILSLLAVSAILSACSTDLEINAPYKNITVVEGLLNMRDSVQLIKINKAFLGDGDALIYAQVQDSSEWNAEAIEYARVVRRLNGQVVGTFDLRDTSVTDREPGTFYAPNQQLYYFVDNFRDSISLNTGGEASYVRLFLDDESEYSIELRIKGEEVSARTKVAGDFSFQAADQAMNVPINLVLGANFNAFELNWTSGLNGKRYVADYRFRYREVRNGELGDVITLTRRLSTVVKTSTGSEAMSTFMDGLRFYEDLASSIPNDPSVQQRKFLGIDFVVSVANDDFHTYLSLTEPISSIIEDRPTFTNVENGLGIFGSRYVKMITGKRLGNASLNELANGDITGHLRFCSAIPGDEISPHFCP